MSVYAQEIFFLALSSCTWLHSLTKMGSGLDTQLSDPNHNSPPSGGMILVAPGSPHPHASCRTSVAQMGSVSRLANNNITAVNERGDVAHGIIAPLGGT